MEELDFKYRMSNETEQPNIGKNLDGKKKYKKKNNVKKDKEKWSGWILKNKNKIKRNNEENDFKLKYSCIFIINSKHQCSSLYEFKKIQILILMAGK